MPWLAFFECSAAPLAGEGELAFVIVGDSVSAGVDFTMTRVSELQFLLKNILLGELMRRTGLSTPDCCLSTELNGVFACVRSLAAFCLMSFSLVILSLPVTSQAQAQSNGDFRVEVLVADQGSRQRDSAYWLAFNRVLRRQVETRVRVEPAQRDELMKNPSLYVQSFRYRKFDSAADSSRLATRKVREGAAPAAVITVSFPADIAAIVQQQLIPAAVEEEVPVAAPVIALVAVEQQGNQFIIGGDRGKKFQSRAMQLAAANNLLMEFPVIEAADLDLISAADILSGDTDRINSFVSRFSGNDLLTGALYRLSPTTWQSDWSYSSGEQAAQSFSLTTATLDEALVAAMTQISPGGSYLSSTYNDGTDASFERSGVEIRVENIKSLADYDSVLAVLKQLDADVVTATLEYEAIVFRATDQGAPRVRDSLIANRRFEALNTDQFSDSLSFRYQAR